MLRALDKEGKKLDVEYDGKVPLYDKPAKKAPTAKKAAAQNEDTKVSGDDKKPKNEETK